MTWVRIDDGAVHHEKLLAAGPDAVTLWLAGLCYANRLTTDGVLARGTLLALYPSETLPPARVRKAAARLVEVGLWEELGPADGWRIRNYERYQREAMSATRDRRREADKVSKQEKRAPKSESDPPPVGALSESDTPPTSSRSESEPTPIQIGSAPSRVPARAPAPARPVPSRPVPSSTSPTSTESAATTRAEADRVRDPQLAEVAWTNAVGARGGSFVANPSKDAPAFRAIAALVAKLNLGRDLRVALRASADAHLAQRTTGKSTPEWWLEWLQREASAGPKAAARTPERDRYVPAETYEPPAPPTVAPVLGASGEALLASLGIVPPTETH